MRIFHRDFFSMYLLNFFCGSVFFVSQMPQNVQSFSTVVPNYNMYFTINQYSHLTHNIERLALLDILITKELIQINNQSSAEDNPLFFYNEAYIKDFHQSNGNLSKYLLAGSGSGSDSDSSSLDNLDLSMFTSNPVLIFRLLHRVSHLSYEFLLDRRAISKIFKNIQEKTDQLGVFIQGSSTTAQWPSQEDLDNLIDNIIHLQHVYDFNIRDFSEGKIPGGVEPQGVLAPSHLYEIGMFAKLNEFWTLSYEWFHLASQKGLKTQMDQVLVHAAIQDVVRLHDDRHGTDDGTFEGVPNPWFYNKKIGMTKDKTKLVKRRTSVNRRCMEHNHKRTCAISGAKYWALCQGKELQSETEKSGLFCWLEQKQHKGLLIAPMKMEFLSRDPDIVQIYNFIPDSAIDRLDKRLRNEKEWPKSKTNNNNNKTGLTVHEAERIIINDFVRSSRIEMVTGLKISSNYKSALNGFGKSSLPGKDVFAIHTQSTFGSYSDSGDFTPLFSKKVESQRDLKDASIAIFRVHLSHVAFGGSTTFENHVAAQPIKGSAVFWYNLKGDWSRDEEAQLLMPDCPVMGKKIVATRFIKLSDQTLTHQCSAYQGKRYRIKANDVILADRRAQSAEDDPTEDESETDSEDESDSDFNFAETGKNQNNTNGFTYGSVTDVKNLVVIEKKIYEYIKDQFPREDSWEKAIRFASLDVEVVPLIFKLQGYVKDYEETSLKLFSLNRIPMDEEEFLLNHGVETISWNILAAYRMVWRFNYFLQPIVQDERRILRRKYTPAPVKEVIVHLMEKSKQKGWPLVSGLAEAMMGIIQLHYIYDLTARDLIAGEFMGIKTNLTLKPIHSYEIGKHAMDSEFYTLGVDWLERTVFAVVHEIPKLELAQITIDQALDELKKAKGTHDRLHKLAEGWEPYFFSDLLSYTDFYHKERQTWKDQQYNAFKGRDASNFVNINFWGICGDKLTATLSHRAKLFCWLETEIHPYWKINPLRAEIHAMFPDAKIEVVQYHNILSDRKIEIVKKKAQDKLSKGLTVNRSDKDSQDNSKLRLSATGWVNDDDAPETLYMNRLSGMITGLKTLVKTPDDIQIASYTPGSHYTVHPDAVRVSVGDPKKQETNTSSRLATFMFYLSDVTKGGNTAFVQAAVSVRPEKGSAVFWYNLYSDMDVNDFTWHGSCPVIFGEKWVSNKWVHYEPQDKMLCDLTPETPREVLVNGKSKYKKKIALLHEDYVDVNGN